MKMIEVVIGGRSYSIYYSEYVYQFKENNEVVFESEDYETAREQLRLATGV